MRRTLLLLLAAAGSLTAISPCPAATLQYDQATGLAHLDIGDSPSGKILGYVLTSNEQFFVDPLRSTSFGVESAPFYENKPGIIGDNDLAFNGTANSIALGQLFPSTLSSVQELAARFTSRIYVPSLGGGEHHIGVRFIDLDGVAWNEPAPAPPLPPVEPPPAFEPVSPPTADIGSFPATLRYHQATGQAYLTPGASPSGKILGYVLTSNDQFFVDPTRSTSFGGESATFYENAPFIIGDNDLSFQGTSAEIPLGQLFPTTLGSVDDLAASFTGRTYVPSLGGGEHPIKLEYIDLDGNVWDEPAPLPPVVVPPIELPPYTGPVQPELPVDVAPPNSPVVPPLVDVDVPQLDYPQLDPPPVDEPQVELPQADLPDVIIHPGYEPLTWDDLRLLRPSFGADGIRLVPYVFQPGSAVDVLALDGVQTPPPITLDHSSDAIVDLVLAVNSISDAPVSFTTWRLNNATTADAFTLSPNNAFVASMFGEALTLFNDANVVIPEPATAALCCLALAAVVRTARRRQPR